MTDEMKKEIRNLSKKYIEALSEIERQKNAKESFEESLTEKIEADMLNKKIFLKNNAELTGLTLEFRNIFGIEGGIYEEKKFVGKPFIYPEGTPEEDKYDCKLLVEACGSISDLGEITLPENSPFFVDTYRNQESSNYYIPFCPPNLSTWCADKLYPGHTRMFYKTENIMVNFIKGLYEATGSFTVDGTISGFNYANPVSFYSDANGSILRGIYKINANPGSIPKPPGGGFYTPSSVEEISKEVGYTLNTGSLTANTIFSFRLTGANGIKSGEYGYAYVYKVENGKVYLDLFHYNGPLVSTATTYYRRKLWRFWDKIAYTNPQPFSLEFSKKLVNNVNVLKGVLDTYEKTYIDGILHYLDRIELPDKGTKESRDKMREVKNSFNQYRKDGKLAPLIASIESRRNWIYQSATSSVRAQQIHDHMRNSDIFDKVYGTINNRINKRTGTLRELMKYAFNVSVADGIVELKRESLTSFGTSMVVYPLINDTNGTNTIEIKLEEGETVDSFYEYIKWMSEVYLLTDNEKIPFFKTRIVDVKERGEEALFLTLSDSVPEDVIYKNSENARLIKLS